jgi:hypothetical protein
LTHQAESVDLEIMEMSFAGGSWNVVYHIGILRFLQEDSGFDLSQWQFLGASSGCIPAVAAACDIPWQEVKESYDRLASNSRASRTGPMFKMSKWQNEAISYSFNRRPHVYRKAQKRLHLCVSHFPPKSYQLINEFESNSHLQNIMLGSFFIPFYSTQMVKHRGRLCIDGSFSNNKPTLSDRTITASAVDTSASVHPRTPYKPFSGFKPRDPSRAWKMYREGYENAYSYFEKHSHFHFEIKKTKNSINTDSRIDL